MKNSQIKIVIPCYRFDYFLTKLCVASIRYYYPATPIFIVKDKIAGNFSTKELETYFNIQVLDLGIDVYGWTTAKIHLLITKKLKNEKILLLDSDTIFAGRVLDQLEEEMDKYDFIVSLEKKNRRGTEDFKKLYFDPLTVQKEWPTFRQPDFGFNTGQILITVGKITAKEIRKYIKFDHFPYWTSFSQKYLPCGDQSLLNIILPLKEQLREVKIKRMNFMVWSEENSIKNIRLTKLSLKVLQSGKFHYIIHWAGAIRTPKLELMSRSDILFFFQKFYYSRLPFGKVRFFYNKYFQKMKYAIVPVQHL